MSSTGQDRLDGLASLDFSGSLGNSGSSISLNSLTIYNHIMSLHPSPLSNTNLKTFVENLSTRIVSLASGFSTLRSLTREGWYKKQHYAIYRQNMSLIVTFYRNSILPYIVRLFPDENLPAIISRILDPFYGPGSARQILAFDKEVTKLLKLNDAAIRQQPREIKCDKVVRLVQNTGTCWLNALLMVLFFSQGVRGVLLRKMDSWDHTHPLFSMFVSLLNRYTTDVYTHDEDAYKFISELTPNKILHHLHLTDPEKFNIDVLIDDAWTAENYLDNLMLLLHVHTFIMCDAVKFPGENEFTVYVSGLYHITRRGIEIASRHVTRADAINSMSIHDQTEIIAIRVQSPFPNRRHQRYIRANSLGTVDLSKADITIRGVSFVIDGLLLTNFNHLECADVHQIAGITCGGSRFIYNGWSDATQDPARHTVGAASNKWLNVPCPLMEKDWLSDSRVFCLDQSDCSLPVAKNEDKGAMCMFNPFSDTRTLLCVRQDLYGKGIPDTVGERADTGKSGHETLRRVAEMSAIRANAVRNARKRISDTLLVSVKATIRDHAKSRARELIDRGQHRSATPYWSV